MSITSRNMKKAPHILLGVTGSIAAYKAADLVRLMTAREWDVSVVMTRAAKQFVGELTFRTLSRNPVSVEMFAETAEWKAGHISLAEWADLLVIAPCTANMVATLAHGLADDLLSCTALAFDGPLVIAPAMNEKMWDHPAVQANMETLKERGAGVVEVGTGDLACGRQGRGRMAEPEQIVTAVSDAIRRRRGKGGRETRRA